MLWQLSNSFFYVAVLGAINVVTIALGVSIFRYALRLLKSANKANKLVALYLLAVPFPIVVFFGICFAAGLYLASLGRF